MTTRADFVRWLRSQHGKKADGVLEILKRTYAEWLKHKKGIDAISRKLWNKRTKREMRPSEKLAFVLTNVGGCLVKGEDDKEEVWETRLVEASVMIGKPLEQQDRKRK